MKPKVSIILAAYNLGKYIKEAIDSLLQQDVDYNFEIIIIDDASTDNTLEVLQQYNFDFIKIYKNSENLGANKSVQKGFEFAQGEYICRFDPDDTWHKDFLKTCSMTLDEHPDIALVYTDIQTINSESKITSPVRHNLGRPNFTEGVLKNELFYILKNYYICAPGIMARREAWDMTLPIPTHLKPIDWYMSCCILKSSKAYFVDKPLAYYRVHPKNMHTAVVLDKHEEHVCNFMMKQFVDNNKSFSFGQKIIIKSFNSFHLAEKYFSVGYWHDAKRWYLKTLCNPSILWFKLSFWRHFIATLAPRFYNKLKAIH